MEENLAILDAATDEFGSLLTDLSDADWTRPTPCSDWNVGELVDHVIGAAAIYDALLNGRSFDDAMTAGQPSDASRHDRQAAFKTSTSGLRRGFHSPGALAKACDIPGGSVTGAGLVAVRVFDVTVHCWDLARSTGASEVFPESVVNYAWSYARGHYGQSQAAQAAQQAEKANSPDTTLAALLFLTGRSPGSSIPEHEALPSRW